MCVAAAPHRELQRVAGRKVDEQQPSAGVQRQVALQQTGCTVTAAAGGRHGMADGGDISLVLACLWCWRVDALQKQAGRDGRLTRVWNMLLPT